MTFCGLSAFGTMPGLAPAGDLLSFCGAKKKVGKEKGPKTIWPVRLEKRVTPRARKHSVRLAEGRQPQVRGQIVLAPLSLPTFFLAQQKESRSPAGARPGNAAGKPMLTKERGA
jgi:hypothetical protein